MSKKQIRRAAKRKPAGPLLAVDGDSFAHRSYHALPKTIRMAGNKPAGAVLGFANFLLKLHEAEQPRAVVVGWDTLEARTYRHKAFAAYQSGREFDRELLAQFPLLREFVAACGFINARKAGYCASSLNPGGASSCTNTLTVEVTNNHMSRTPDQRTFDSESYDAQM